MKQNILVTGASLFVTLQHFTYKTFENAINKRVNTTK